MASPSTLPVVSSEAVSLLGTLDTSLLSEIISFVGPKHYLFIASIDRRFQQTYVETFPNDKYTYLNASTIGYARICYDLNRSDRRRQRALTLSAAKHGNLAALQFLHAADCLLTDHIYNDDGLLPAHICHVAARNGHLTVLQWCRENGCPWDEQTCADAAFGGHLHVLQWCRDNGCTWDEQTCAYAAGYGHLDVLQWCRENDCPWNENTSYNAAMNGHLNILQWCREKGCPWDEQTCAFAAMNGYLDILQWCREKGCPWDECTCYFAAMNGYLDILQWCRDNGCPEFDEDDLGEEELDDDDEIR